MLKDSFGRKINSLRISVTDRCNFRCSYCMPEEGMKWLDKEEILSYEEIFFLVKIFSELGINKIRLTGGEPLVRKDLYKLIFLISNIEKIEDISLTTNGYFLAEMAEKLYNSGLKRINISLDSLNPSKFNLITRRNYFHKVLDGIESAITAGFYPIKINAVIMRGINDNELGEFAKLSRKSNLKIRFIEFMPIGSKDGWKNNKVVTYKEIIIKIEDEIGLKLKPIATVKSDPARKYSFEDGIGEIGFINSVSEPFCEHCNRIRITAEGKLRTCLFSLSETDLKTPLRKGMNKNEIAHLIKNAVWNKERGHLINKPGFVRPNRTMSQIGG
ncbi:MAG: GTP 3',8-cyclase MoaA [Thermodesulfobacteriota bacterium]